MSQSMYAMSPWSDKLHKLHKRICPFFIACDNEYCNFKTPVYCLSMALYCDDYDGKKGGPKHIELVDCEENNDSQP